MSRFTVLVTDRTWASTEREAAALAEVDAEIVEAPSGRETELVELAAEPTRSSPALPMSPRRWSPPRPV